MGNGNKRIPPVEELSSLLELYQPKRISCNLRKLLFAFLQADHDLPTDLQEVLFDINLLFELLELLDGD